MPIELSRDSFKELGETAAVPKYDPRGLKAGIGGADDVATLSGPADVRQGASPKGL